MRIDPDTPAAASGDATSAQPADAEVLDERVLAHLDEDDRDWIEEDLADVVDEAGVAATPLLGRVAVIGYPNVGKSTLVNRLTGTREAIVHDTPGVTRDRKEIPCEWNGERFLLVDTGGIDAGDPTPVSRQVVQQARLAIDQCDVVLFVVDAQAGPSAADTELAELLRRARTPVILAATKVDDARRENEAAVFFELGLGTPIPVSGQHGTNTGDLLDIVVEDLREHGTPVHLDEQAPRIAVVGRPNVGKSTLVNAILGSGRTVVADLPGTTRDSIDTALDVEGRSVVLVDTAGLRRRRSGQDPLDYYSEVRALQAADRADVAILLIDASEGVREQDLSIADQLRSRSCSILVALSKWDVNEVDLADVRAEIATKLRQRPEIVTTSATAGRNIAKVLRTALELYDRAGTRVGTGELNRVLRRLKEQHPPPLDRRSRRRLNIMYGTQVGFQPPKLRIFVNDKRLVTRDYAYFIENRLREHFGLQGVALDIEYRGRER